jgi:hypothetical protein
MVTPMTLVTSINSLDDPPWYRGDGLCRPRASRWSVRQEYPDVGKRITGSLLGSHSIAPKVLEPCRRKFGIAHRMLDGPMAQPVLNSPRVMPGVR